MSLDERFDRENLLPVVVQDELTGEVRMVAWASREALAKTMETGKATFFSRSRDELWEKGATSGNAIAVSEVRADCDEDCLLYAGRPSGPSCHTGQETCFFRVVRDAKGTLVLAEPGPPTALARLERVLEERRTSSADKSYTKSLYEGGAARIGAKITEEAGELARAIASETDARVVSEAADLLFHAMVGLRSRGVALRDVYAEIARRMGTSGHDEKRARGG